jgi:ADP-ribosylglycohydrolase
MRLRALRYWDGQSVTSSSNKSERTYACLLGGAIGDALGAGVEFDRLESILRTYGGPVTGYVPAYGRRGAVTDDTQMTLFAVEGLVTGLAGGGSPDDLRSAVRDSYLRWLAGQRTGVVPAGGWLPADPLLGAGRAPGNTCMSGLSAGCGTTDRPVNAGSKGCGTVMRAAPYAFLRRLEPDARCSLAIDDAALTHGHPTAWAASAALVSIISAVVEGLSMGDAVASTVAAPARLGPSPGELVEVLQLALSLPAAPTVPRELGEGWVGDEALGIAVWSALTAPDPRAAIVLAVNHDGDSDSTGSICGQLLGAAVGDFLHRLPAEWITGNEATDLVALVAERFDRAADTSP